MFKNISDGVLKKFLHIFSEYFLQNSYNSMSNLKIMGFEGKSSKFTVQYNFTSLHFKATASELIDQNLVMLFDKNDVALIFYVKGLECRQETSLFTIKSIEYKCINNIHYSVVSCLDKSKSFFFKSNAKDLFFNKEKLAFFDSKDKLRIIYLAGLENIS